jgi:GH15 family glucan-1,4-alpha-glucosidase
VTELSIADHGLVGDLKTAALISADGSVDWFCCPRLDSPSVFGALLDPGGGHFRIRPATSGYRARRMYLPDKADHAGLDQLDGLLQRRRGRWGG